MADGDAALDERVHVPPRAAAAVSLAAVGVVAVWSRFAVLGTGFWLDEAFAATVFSDAGPGAIFDADLYIPNNHVLYSVLTWATIGPLGHAEPVYRLWSVLPALAAVALLAAWAWRRLGPWYGVGVALLATANPEHLELAVQARGYGLGFLASVTMLLTALGLHGRRGPWATAAFAAAGALGICTLPIMVLPFVAHAAVLFGDRAARRDTLLAVAAAAVASLAWYAPLLTKVVEYSRQDFGSPLPWHAPLSAPADDLLRSTFDELGIGALTYAVAALLAAVGASWLWSTGRGAVAAHTLIPTLGTYLVLTATRAQVVPRFTSYLLLPVLLLLGCGLGRLCGLAARPGALRVGVAAVATVAGAFTVKQAVDQSNRLLVPLEAYREVADVVEHAGIDRIFTNSPVSAGLNRYFDDTGIAYPDAPELRRLVCEERGPLAFVEYAEYAGALDAEVAACLERRDPVTIVFPQRNGTEDGWMRVHFVPG